jgi:two-component system, chemotaxis family, CheB/CheR fusion protein
MLFAEALGAEEFRARVKVYATDVDEEALDQARSGSYTAKEIEELDPGLRKRYFEAGDGRYAFSPELRRSVIFGRHDLVQDAPISRLDLLICRNTLMYFNAETQKGILERFHFALNGKGVLFLGRAEMLLSHAGLFTPLDQRHRVFAKILPRPAQERQPAAPVAETAERLGGRNGRLKNQAAEEEPTPRIVVDVDGTLTMANARARVLFSISPRDIGRQVSDLEVSYRPLELRSLIELAYAERHSVTRTSVERRFADGEVHYLDISASPMFDDSQNALGVSVSFVDVTRFSRLAEDLRRAQEEVQTTNEELQSSNEELETTNEELQSSNEELETTNEELQSTNEELETMNEELQSTNEELQTVNEELRNRTEEANRVNAFLESVLAGLRSAAVVVNAELNVLMWNHRAEELWGLRADEVQGKPLLNLDIGLPVAELRSTLRACLAGEVDHKEQTIDAVNRRGKQIRCHVSCAPLVAAKKREGVILLMEEA